MEVCRSCLMHKNLMGIEENFIKNFNLLTNLNIMLHDGLPQYVCQTCFDTVISFITFREQSITSDKKLQLLIDDKNHEFGFDVILTHSNSTIKEEDIKSEKSESFENFEDNIDDYQATIDGGHNVDVMKTEKDSIVGKVKIEKRKIYKKLKKEKNLCITNESKLLCGICPEILTSKESLSCHLDTHRNETTCAICREEFQNFIDILIHRYQHLSTTSFECHLCSDKKFKHIEVVTHHYNREHLGNKEFKLQCRKCSRQFLNRKSFQSHRAACQDSKLICDYCSKAISDKFQMVRHLKKHTNERPYSCADCGKRFKLRSTLQAHKVHKHNLDRVDCPKCYRVFKGKEKFEKHDCKPKNIICPDCGKQFDRESVYYSHRISHSEVHKFECKICSAKYKRKKNLNDHMSKHEGVRKHACQYCSAKFFSKDHLCRHLRLHSGEKPHVCEICDKGFVRRYNLKVHMETHGIYLINKKEKVLEVSVDA